MSTAATTRKPRAPKALADDTKPKRRRRVGWKGPKYKRSWLGVQTRWCLACGFHSTTTQIKFHAHALVGYSWLRRNYARPIKWRYCWDAPDTQRTYDPFKRSSEAQHGIYN